MQVASDDVVQVKNWAHQYPGTNWEVVCGPSRLVGLDVDPRHGGDVTLAALERKNKRMPVTPRCETGGGGIHLYFLDPRGFPIKNRPIGPGLAVRARNGLLVLPGSLHESGIPYRWASDAHPDEVPLSGLPSWLLDLLQREQRDRDTEAISVSPYLRISVTSVEEAIASTIPDGTGQRNRRIFEFARALKSLQEYADADAGALQGIVKQWHERALPHIGTKPFDDTWGDFVNGWKRVKFPRGQGALADVLAKAGAAADPPWALRYESESTRLLIRLCAELQRHAGADPFFLSCPTAGNLVFGGDRMTAWRRFGMLVADGVLEVVERHTASKATRYRFLGER
jgi:hypothetical protein